MQWRRCQRCSALTPSRFNRLASTLSSLKRRALPAVAAGGRSPSRKAPRARWSPRSLYFSSILERFWHGGGFRPQGV